MRITVRLFALQRAQTGLRSLELELDEGASVEDAWAALVGRLPQLEPAGSSVRFARNDAYVDIAERLEPDDVLAIIPPVAGGAAGAMPAPEHGTPSGDEARVRRIEVTASPLDEATVGEVRAAIATPADGAVALFVGQTRETPGTPAPGQEADAARFAGQHVEGLAYEAYEPMALAVLEAIADEIETRFGVRRLAILHRVGEVGVGETSVIVAAGAPHRSEAFDACRYAIEELKARAPIWKAERFGDGSVWIGAPARSGPEEAG